MKENGDPSVKLYLPKLVVMFRFANLTVAPCGSTMTIMTET